MCCLRLLFYVKGAVEIIAFVSFSGAVLRSTERQKQFLKCNEIQNNNFFLFTFHAFIHGSIGNNNKFCAKKNIFLPTEVDKQSIFQVWTD